MPHSTENESCRHMIFTITHILLWAISFSKGHQGWVVVLGDLNFFGGGGTKIGSNFIIAEPSSSNQRSFFISICRSEHICNNSSCSSIHTTKQFTDSGSLLEIWVNISVGNQLQLHVWWLIASKQSMVDYNWFVTGITNLMRFFYKV